jgi:hypothetical protein
MLNEGTLKFRKCIQILVEKSGFSQIFIKCKKYTIFKDFILKTFSIVILHYDAFKID